MEIRLATEADTEALIEMDPVAETDPARGRMIRDQIAASACYVVMVDGAIGAYGILNYKFYDNGWVEMLYVDPRSRRRGMGSALMRHFADECRTAKLFTSTNESNVPMQQLLESIGFERSGVIDNLDEGDPELVYFRRVGG